MGDGDFVVVEVGCGDTEAVTELVPPAAAVADGVALTDGVVLRDGELETVAAVGAVGAEAVPEGATVVALAEVKVLGAVVAMEVVPFAGTETSAAWAAGAKARTPADRITAERRNGFW